VAIDLAWTLTNILHCVVHLYFLHTIKGTPWQSTDLITETYRLTYWEQINDGEQNTATRKFLTAVPIVLFLLTCMYTKQAVGHFVPNFLALVVITIPKLPQFHLVRLFGINKY
jgi:ORMDL family